MAELKWCRMPSWYVSVEPSIALEHQAARGRLLVGHADGALVHRPRLAVAGIERVVDLADEVGEAALVEARGVGAAERVEPLRLRRRDVGVDGIGRRREVVRAFATHLVQIDDDVREVVERDLLASARLRLGPRDPVAVHVEQVVVGAATGPRLIALRGQAIAIGHGRAARLVLEDEARAPVGVLERVDEHQRVARDLVGHRIVDRGQQVIRLGERRIR